MPAGRVFRAGHQLEQRGFAGGRKADESGVQHKPAILARVPRILPS